VNFQVTVLKILVSYPGGFATMEDLKRDMAILATSGREWTDRTRRLGARMPGLDIFSRALIERSAGGWRITEKGRAVLDVMEGRSADALPVADEPSPVLQSTEVRSLPIPVERDRRQSGRQQRRRAAREQARARAS
jgi:hypothetical protein